MTHDPAVSIIVATRNAASTLQACIDSIVAQRAAVELIVVDGASTDGTADQIAAASDAIAWWCSEPDDGLYDAWNKALPHASAPWIAFLGADDRLASPDAMHDLLAGVPTCLGSRVIYGTNEIRDSQQELVDTMGAPWPEMRKRFLREMYFPHPGTLHHRSIFDDTGPFNTTFTVAGDYELLLRELATGDACFIDGTTTCVVGSGGISRLAHAAASMKEADRALAMHGVPRSRVTRLRLRAKHRVKSLLVRGLGERRATRMIRRIRPHRKGSA